ncbi:MAG: SpoIIE family protein phosphatase [Verrucomicrobiota bacterium]
MKRERLPSKALEVLFINADEEMSEKMIKYLHVSTSRTFQVTRVRTLQEGIHSLGHHHFGVILMDLDLPDLQGIECFDQIHKLAPTTPTVLLVDSKFEDAAVEAVQAGAQEYVIASLTTQRALTRAIMYAVTKVQDSRALALQTQLMDNLMQNTPDRIFFKDKDSKFIRISRATTEHFGLVNPDKAVGKTDFDFFSQEHAQQAYEDEQEILNGGTPIVGKIEKETFDDDAKNDYWALTTKMPLLDEDGEVIGTFGISRDFTHQKKMEDQLEHERDQLNRLSEELREQNAVMEEDMHMAREVQQALIPQELRTLKGGKFGDFNIHPFYRPATSVGGDFVYFIPIGADRLGVFICDVMGHGLRASMITAVLRGLMEELVRDSPDPGDFMSELNRLIFKILHSSNTVNLISGYYLLLDRNSQEVRVSNAGHPKPVRFNRQTKAVSVFSTNDNDRFPALGIDEETEYQTGFAEMAPEETLLLYTDGLIEAGSEELGLWGMDGLAQAIQAKADLPANLLFEHIMRQASDFNQSPDFEDDICMVAVERGSASSEK